MYLKNCKAFIYTTGNNNHVSGQHCITRLPRVNITWQLFWILFSLLLGSWHVQWSGSTGAGGGAWHSCGGDWLARSALCWRRDSWSRIRGELKAKIFKSAGSTQDCTVRCHCNAVQFLQNIVKSHPIACPLGRGMGCLLSVQSLIDILSLFLQWCVQCDVILDHVITALDCSISSVLAMEVLQTCTEQRSYRCPALRHWCSYSLTRWDQSEECLKVCCILLAYWKTLVSSMLAMEMLKSCTEPYM